MKKLFYKISWVAAVIAVASVSCSKDFGDMNQDPGRATSPIPSGLLTNVLSNLDNQVWNGGGVSTIGGLYCQYYSETQYTEASRYAKQFPDWDAFYAGDMFDLQNIINYNSDPNTATIAAQYGSNNNQIAIARILKAYYYWFLTDNYGDLPYSGALKGDNGLVVYDKQQDVYTDLFKELTEAVAQFDDGIAVKGDILFGGDNTMWKKFANSMRALMALQIANADAAKGKAEFAAALAADGGVFEAGQGAKLSYPDANFPNPVYNYYAIVQRKDYAISETLTGYLAALGNDPRVNAFASSDVGFPYGLTRDDAIAFSNAHTDWARLLQGDATPVTKPFYILSCSEIYLARAQAAFKGWTSESVNDMYVTGMSENWKQWGVFDQATFDEYLTGVNVALGTDADEELISIQEWLSHFPNGTLGWDTWRRTGFPGLEAAPGLTSIPRRFAYGTNNYNLNGINTKAASAQYDVAGDPDSQLGRVWWDK